MPVSRRVRKSRIAASKHVAIHEDVEAKELTRDEQFDVFLEDFERQVQSQMESIRKKGDELCKTINQRLKVELMKLPKEIKEMTVKQYAATHPDTVIGRTYCKIKAMENEAVQEKNDDMQIKPEAVPNEGSSNGSSATDSSPVFAPIIHRPAKKGRKRAASSKKKENLRPVINSCTVTKSKAGTPLTANPPPWASDTPLFTPKFDPRLPFTPASGLRRVKKNEELIVMSMRGSPVFLAPDSPVELVTLDNGRSKAVACNVDADTRMKLAMMKEKLSELAAKSS